jgi:hypothetical protein
MNHPELRIYQANDIIFLKQSNLIKQKSNSTTDEE